jgi:hypothetical protein
MDLPRPDPGDNGRKSQNAAEIDAGADVDTGGEFLAVEEADARQQAQARRHQPDPGRADAVQTVGHPERQGCEQDDREPPLRGAQRRPLGAGLDLMGRSRKQPRQAGDEHAALEDAEHGRVQHEIRHVVELHAIGALGGAGHDQVRHIGRQDRGGELIGAEADRERQRVAARRSLAEAGAIGQRQDDRHQQRDAQRSP